MFLLMHSFACMVRTWQASAAGLRFDPARERDLTMMSDALSREVSDLQVCACVRWSVCVGVCLCALVGVC